MPVLEEAEERGIVGESGYNYGSSTYGPSYSYSECMDRSNLSFAEKQTIIEELSAMLGYGYHDISLAVLTGSGASDTNGASGSSGSYINANAPLWSYGNLYDIAMVMVHEKNHQDTPWDSGTNFSEMQAYRASWDNPYYQYTSAAYRDKDNCAYMNYYNKWIAGNP
jgi:hypothetical protein